MKIIDRATGRRLPDRLLLAALARARERTSRQLVARTSHR